MKNLDLSSLSDGQVQDLFHHLCQARQIMEQEASLEELITKGEVKYAENYWKVLQVESWVFNEHIKREKK